MAQIQTKQEKLHILMLIQKDGLEELTMVLLLRLDLRCYMVVQVLLNMLLTLIKLKIC